jgi:ATP-dependent RNA helicase DDX24/MAK5
LVLNRCELKITQDELQDLYLYYFLLRYPGRTLIFLNSIDGIRRLQPILSNLRVASFPLHSHLQQRQRLKNLDHFRSANISNGRSAVLLATDVAARGLDIPAVDHVIHYQIPRSADTYVHRSGRTGRAGKPGVSLAMAEPAEKKLINQVMNALKRSESLTYISARLIRS